MATANSSEILQAQVSVYRRLIDPEWLDGKVAGTLSISAQFLPQVELLEARGDLTLLLGELREGELIKAELAPLRSQQAFFARSLDALLCAHDFRTSPPAAFYLADSDFLNLEQMPSPVPVSLYGDTCKFARLIGQCADYIDKEAEQSFIFLQKEKFELPIAYTAEQLRALPGLDELETSLSEDLHQEQKRTIVATISAEMLRPIARPERFAFLLHHFDDWLQRFKDSYRLYVSEFSFEKVREDVETHRLEYTARLNKVISDIQGQLLAIPVSLLIVATQMKRNGTALFNDTLIVIGCLIFAVLMNFLLRNQRHTLDVIYGEIQRQSSLMAERYAPIADKFGDIFRLLERRYRHQKMILYTIDVLVMASLAATVAIYILGNRFAFVG